MDSRVRAAVILATLACLPVNAADVPASGNYCGEDGAYEGCGSDDLCLCEVQLARAVRRRPVDVDFAASRGGSPDPRDIFTRGGTESAPVVCRAAKYLADGRPEWFSAYFDLQFGDPGVPTFGKEGFSDKRFPHVLGSVIAVRKKASSSGRIELVVKADRWLRAYWSMAALAANPSPAAGGYVMAVPGVRSYVDSRSGGAALQEIFLSMALGRPGRARRNEPLIASPGRDGGLCAAALTLGYPWSGGQPSLASMDPGPLEFGLTSAERSALRSYIASNGDGLNTVLSYLEEVRMGPELSIQRLPGVVNVWFGDPGKASKIAPQGLGAPISTVFFPHMGPVQSGSAGGDALLKGVASWRGAAKDEFQ